MSTLYTMVGLPGSGKSTFSKNHAECVVVSTDEIRAELFGDASVQAKSDEVFRIAFQRIAENLKNGKDVIFDATNVSVKSRKSSFRFNAKHVAVYVSTDVAECKRRNANRDRKVNENVIDRIASRLVIPTKAEGFDEIIVIWEKLLDYEKK